MILLLCCAGTYCDDCARGWTGDDCETTDYCHPAGEDDACGDDTCENQASSYECVCNDNAVSCALEVRLVESCSSSDESCFVV